MKKFLKYFLITIVATEISLQITSYALQSYVSYSQRSANSGKGKYRIICIGESTTARGFDNSYPVLLERRLNSLVGGTSFEVINAGISGITTKVIAGYLPKWIDEYQPDAAIVMSGINDYWSLPDNQTPAWEKSLEWLSQYSRIAKVARITYINSKFQDTTFKKSLGTCGMPDASGFAAPSNFNDYISQSSTINKNQGPAKAINFLKEKINYLNDHGFCEDAYPLQAQVVRLQRDSLKDPKLALETIDEMLKQNIMPKKRYIFTELKSSLRLQLGLPPDDHVYAKATNYWDNSSYKINIQNIIGQLQAQNIPVIVMQYPRLPVEPLKKIISNHNGLTFLENQNNFDEVLKTKKWDEVFEDSFGGTFGHTTPIGASTLADNAAEAVLTIIPVPKLK